MLPLSVCGVRVLGGCCCLGRSGDCGERGKGVAQADFALPGTLTVRSYACGKPGCRCRADPPRLHGPYAEWTRKIGGKTVTRRLTPRQLAEYQPLFDNAKKLRALLGELHDLTLKIIQADSTQRPQNPAEPEPRPPENVG